MQASKAIFLIVSLIAAVAVVGLGVCETAGWSAHLREAAFAAVIGLTAAIVGLLPLFLSGDRSPVALFQSAWVGSILHMAAAAALGIAALALWKWSTPFVLWLLVMYWITLIGLCVAFVKTMRGPTQQLALG